MLARWRTWWCGDRLLPDLAFRSRKPIGIKNNRGVEDNRVRHMDYGVQLNKLMYQRLIKGGEITLFSPSDVPGLYEAFFADQDEFERLYTQYEQDPNIRKRSVKAVELFSLLMQERASTGRIYIQTWITVTHIPI